MEKTKTLTVSDGIAEDLKIVIGATGLDPGGLWDLQAGVFAIIDRLKIYREEGQPLRPDVFIFHDSTEFQEGTGFLHFFELERLKLSDLKDEVGMIYLRALKKAAPLAEVGWSIFIKWHKQYQEVAFGVMRRPRGLLMLPAEQELSRKYKTAQFLMLRQRADNLVEVVTAQTSREYLFHLKRPSHEQNLSVNRAGLLDAIVSRISDSRERECTRAVIEGVLDDSSRVGHGFLIGVVDQDPNHGAAGLLHQTPEHSHFADGTFFEWPISYSEKIREYHQAAGDAQIDHESVVETYDRLRAWVALGSALIGSDGMTLFDTEGRMLGFKIFLKGQKSKPTKSIDGGARSRAFATMCELIEKGLLRGAYYESQDGGTCWKD